MDEVEKLFLNNKGFLKNEKGLKLLKHKIIFNSEPAFYIQYIIDMLNNETPFNYELPKNRIKRYYPKHLGWFTGQVQFIGVAPIQKQNEFTITVDRMPLTYSFSSIPLFFNNEDEKELKQLIKPLFQ